ncbi:hypothetical protein [Streptomyces sp. NPDC000410]|uniref:hypothetical protein n=1 Tax=Streptomyces sp. NPDC000410 TaxID=3154254 RepID=UPI003319AEB2
MSPAHTTPLRPGQPPRRGKWLTGATVASLALVLAAGVAGPAAADSRDGDDAAAPGAKTAASALPVTEASGPNVTVPAHGSIATQAVCPAGQTAISGGWYTNAAGAVTGVSLQTTTNTSKDTWFVVFDNPGNFDIIANVRAYCSP